MSRPRPGRSLLLHVCVVRGSGREWLAAPGDHVAASGREWGRRGLKQRTSRPSQSFLHETEQHHGNYEKTHAKHNWWDWYAPYLSASERQQSGGSSRRRRSLHGAAPLKTKEDLWPQQK